MHSGKYFPDNLILPIAGKTRSRKTQSAITCFYSQKSTISTLFFIHYLMINNFISFHLRSWLWCKWDNVIKLERMIFISLLAGCGVYGWDRFHMRQLWCCKVGKSLAAFWSIERHNIIESWGKKLFSTFTQENQIMIKFQRLSKIMFFSCPRIYMKEMHDRKREKVQISTTL